MPGRNRRLILPTVGMALTGIALIVLGSFLHVESVQILGGVALGWIAGYHKGANAVIRIIRQGR